MLRTIALCFLMQTGQPALDLNAVDPLDLRKDAPMQEDSNLGVPISTLTHIRGVRSNQISGQGLVVGLNGTGDQSQATRQLIASMFAQRDVNTSARDINAKNAAVVWVTAELPPFVENGSRINATVASLGDATSIVGGLLLQTQLMGTDGTVYALAQGSVVVGGFSAGGDGASVQKNHTTVGIVPKGGIIEETVAMRPVDDQGRMTLLLHDPEYTTARRIADAINGSYPGTAAMVDAGTVRLTIPQTLIDEEQQVAFISQVQRLSVRPEIPARIVINERTGTIVVGNGVRIEPVAINTGNLTFTIQERTVASQPGPFSDGVTERLDRTTVTAEEDINDTIVLDPGVDVSRIASDLNALGVSPRDIISLFIALKDAGALHGEIVRQ